MRRLGLLIGASLGFWAVLAYPARRLGGDEAFAYTAIAAALCLVPTAATLLLAQKANGQLPANALLMLLGGTGIRMAVVLGAGIAISLLGLPGLPEVNVVAFWIWLLVFYLFSLALEVTLVVMSRSPQ
jgi:hypothetical protein